MRTDYDIIAQEYKESKFQPWRTHVERYTLLELVGDPTSRAVIDLACGEGFYTRLLRQLGASPVLGVDLSHRMIDLARSEEALHTLGIEYRVGDVRSIELSEEYDIAFAAYLLNYARNFDELLEMCHTVARALKPGGRFITINNNPDDPTSNFMAGRVYGYTKELRGELAEGAPVVWTFHLPDSSFEVTNYILSNETIERALREVGLRNVQWHEPKVSAEGLQQWGADYWSSFLRSPPVCFLECVK